MKKPNIYYDSWSYSINFCRKYGFCTNKNKWTPWEKKFFFHIYDTCLGREE